MKKLLKYMMIWAGVALLASACTTEEVGGKGDGKGALRLSFDVQGTPTRDGSYDALAQSKSVVRIYKLEGTSEVLIDKYKPSELPEDLYLIAGDYRLKVEAGDLSTATFTNKSYYGELDVTIPEKGAVDKTIVCKIINIGVDVTFGDGFTSGTVKMKPGYKVYVSASDTFSKEAAENNTVPTLPYTADAMGYFLLPEGVADLSWGFYGETVDSDEVSQTGTITAPEGGKAHRLAFKYSKTPDGFLSVTVEVVEYDEIVETPIYFSPQPTITGDGLDFNEIYDSASGDLSVNVSTMYGLDAISIVAGSQTFSVMTGGTTTPVTGITYTTIDDNKSRIVLGADFFAQLEDGLNDLTLLVKDDQGQEARQQMTVLKGQEVTVGAIDTWKNTAEIGIVSAVPVTLEYKRTSSSTWQQATVTTTSTWHHSARIVPTWIDTTNEDGLDARRIDSETGIFAGATYDYRLMVGGNEVKTGQFSSDVTGSQFPDGSFETTWKDDKYFNNNGTTDYAFWASGNNSFADNLCRRNSDKEGRDGQYCAVLTASYNGTAGIPAPGNLFTANFKMSLFPMGGNVTFGKSQTYNARPSAVRVKVSAIIGNVTHNMYGGPLAVGTPDKGRISVAIVDWNAAHTVFAGKANPTGAWDVNKVQSVAEGPIIGYASKFIETTAGNAMEEIEIPIYYNSDTDTPPSGNYTIVVNCSTSAYGDYMNACDTNVMYIDDFRFVY